MDFCFDGSVCLPSLIICNRILLDEESLLEGCFRGGDVGCAVYVYLVFYSLIYLAYRTPDSVDGFRFKCLFPLCCFER